MKKKLIVCLALAVLMVVALAFAACDNSDNECQHVYKDVAEKAATCLTAGNKAYRECIYCGKLFVDGKEVTQNDVTIPADENAHRLTDVAEIPATCVKEGVKAYKKCEICSKTFIDGNEVTAADLVIAINPNAHKLSDVAATAPTCVVDGLDAHQECDYCHTMFLNNVEVAAESIKVSARGYHDWNDEGTCKDCGARKISYNGQDYAADDSNVGIVTPWSESGLRATSKAFPELAEVLYVNGNLWSVQITSAQAQNHVKASIDENGNLFVSHADNMHIHTNYWKDGKPFIGTFIMTFTVTTADDVNMEKYGLGLIKLNDENNVVSAQGHHTLIGSSATAADGTYRTIEAGKPVTFTYLVTVSDAKQIIRMTWYNELKTQTDTTLTDVHFIPVKEVQEGETPAPAAMELLSVEGFKAHEHTYSDEWTSDESEHWHETTCGHTGFNVDTAAHTFNDQDTCTICGYQKEIAHEHNIVDGVCTTCNMSKLAIEIADNGTGTKGENLFPVNKNNPGKFTAQTTKNSKSTVTLNEDGTLSCVINSNTTENTNKIFLRTIVAKDGAAYVGKYTFSLDITVTKGKGNAKDATSVDVLLGFFLQELDESGAVKDDAVIKPDDQVYTLVVGKTYRFSVEVETTNALQLLQFNARNTAGNGVEFTLSNFMVSFQETATPATTFSLNFVEVALPVQKQTTEA